MKRALLICCVVSVMCLTILAWRVPTSGLAQDVSIRAEPTLLDFGAVEVRNTAVRILKVTNTGVGFPAFFSISVEPLRADMFFLEVGIEEGSIFPSDRSEFLPPGKTSEIRVFFEPLRTGFHEATLEIFDSSDRTRPRKPLAQVALRGIGVVSNPPESPAQVCIPVHTGLGSLSTQIGALGLQFSPSPFTPSTFLFTDCRNGSQTAGQFSLEQHNVGPFLIMNVRGGPFIDLDLVQEGSGVIAVLDERC